MVNLAHQRAFYVRKSSLVTPLKYDWFSAAPTLSVLCPLNNNTSWCLYPACTAIRWLLPLYFMLWWSSAMAAQRVMLGSIYQSCLWRNITHWATKTSNTEGIPVIASTQEGSWMKTGVSSLSSCPLLPPLSVHIISSLWLVFLLHVAAMHTTPGTTQP